MKGIKNFFAARGKRMLLIALAVAVLLTTLAVSGIYAKYTYQKSSYGTVVAPNFYFESDLLTENGAKYTLNAGTGEITFTMTNSADDLRFSDSDVTYTVTSSDGTLSITGGTFNKGGKRTVTVTLSDLENGKSYTVEAVGKAGFQKTLSATFTVESEPKTLHMHTQLDSTKQAYVVLTVWTKDLAGTVTVTLPQGLIPDNTDPKMSGFTTATTSFTFDLVKHSSISYRFFIGTWDKTTPFGVTLDDGTNPEPYQAKVESTLG